MRVALALSGGGVRAAVFHCGVLQRLALDGLLESTTFVSTVSGGSLLVGLIMCQNTHRWPRSDEYLTTVLPRVREAIYHCDFAVVICMASDCSPVASGREGARTSWPSNSKSSGESTDQCRTSGRCRAGS